MTGLVQTSSEATRSRASSPLIVSRDSYSPWTLARFQMGGAQPTFADVTIYFWYLIFITLDVCVINFYDLSAWDGCWSSVSIWRFIYRFLDVCPFDSTTVAVSGKVGPVNRLTTPVGWLLSFQLTVLSRSAIAVLSNFFVSSLCIFDFWWSFCLCGVFVIRLRQISSLFSLYLHLFPAAVWSVCNKVPRVRVFKVSLFTSSEFWRSCVRDSLILRSLISHVPLFRHGFKFIEF